ncbi:MAG: hypothetical protein KatS3mg061_2996 [Dehalococcoidia bacterium]|nr:MAG: hypothetical protein KatS3mg061_2996 [Dehalococcoidia bacterium]
MGHHALRCPALPLARGLVAGAVPRPGDRVGGALLQSGGGCPARCPRPAGAYYRWRSGKRAGRGAQPVKPAPLLEVRDLRVSYPTPRGLVRAVEEVSFQVYPGEAVGLVGESGSGKTTVLRALLGLIQPPGQVSSTLLRFKEQDLRELSEEEWRAVRGGQISMIFQDPVNAFNPALTIGPPVTAGAQAPPPGATARWLRCRDPPHAPPRGDRCARQAGELPIQLQPGAAPAYHESRRRALGASPRSSWRTSPPRAWMSPSRHRCSSYCATSAASWGWR